jgi:hypothetical protein
MVVEYFDAAKDLSIGGQIPNPRCPVRFVAWFRTSSNEKQQFTVCLVDGEWIQERPIERLLIGWDTHDYKTSGFSSLFDARMGFHRIADNHESNVHAMVRDIDKNTGFPPTGKARRLSLLGLNPSAGRFQIKLMVQKKDLIRLDFLEPTPNNAGVNPASKHGCILVRCSSLSAV